jgi:uridine kinase
MAELYVVPSAARASITVEGTDALDWSVEQVLQRLRQTGRLSQAESTATNIPSESRPQ